MPVIFPLLMIHIPEIIRLMIKKKGNCREIKIGRR